MRYQKALISAVLVFLGGVAATAVDAQQSNPATDYVNFSVSLALDDKCKLVNSVQRAALVATQNEILIGYGEAQVAPVKAAAAQAAAKAVADGCGAPMALQAKSQLPAFAEAQRAIWLSRASTLANGANTYATIDGNWGAGITTVSARAAELEAASKAAYAAATIEVRDMISGQPKYTLSMLRAACYARRTLRSATPRKCPGVSQQEEGHAAEADLRVGLIETFVATAGPLQGSIQASDIGRIQDYWRFERAGSLVSVMSGGACKAGDLVIKVGSAMKDGDYILTRLGSPQAVGKVSTEINGSDLFVDDFDEGAARAGIVDLGMFKPCRSGP
jgi:hypothetical protein